MDGVYVACADLHNDHNVMVYEVNSGKRLWTSKGDTNKIMDIAFTQKPGDYSFCSAGIKHTKFWNVKNGTGSKGICGSAGAITNFSCV